MKLSRKERKQLADKKRKVYSDKMILFFLTWNEKLNEKNGKRPMTNFKECYTNFHMIRDEYTKKHPEDAHLIRSAFIEAKQTIKNEFKDELK